MTVVVYESKPQIASIYSSAGVRIEYVKDVSSLKIEIPELNYGGNKTIFMWDPDESADHEPPQMDVSLETNWCGHTFDTQKHHLQIIPLTLI